MFARTMGIITALAAVVGWGSEKEVPINAETHQLDLTQEAEAKLKAYFGDDLFASMQETINGEIKAFYDKNDDIKAVSDQIAALLKEKQAKAEELETTDDRDTAKALSAQIKALDNAHKTELAALKQQIAVLSAAGIGNIPASVIDQAANGGKQHSATHLYGIADPWQAFDQRPWNARVKEGGMKATDFLNNSEIPTLNGDLEHFIRKNPDVIKSWFDDFEDLPTDWDRQSGIIDRVASGSIAVGEIVQGRKKGWFPKNKFKFAVEEGRVFRKQIDIEFDGYELQQLETTWIAQLKNMDGSQPWKMSFIGYLMSEIAKRQRLDDRVAQINGIYAADPNQEAAGANLESQNGLRYYWWYYRDSAKKYRSFVLPDMDKPTKENIVDYVNAMIEQIPVEHRTQQGLEIQLSQEVLQWYRKKAGDLYALKYDTDLGKAEYTLNHPIDYSNFKFQPLKDMTKTLFIGITYSKNIRVLDYDISEKSRMTIGHEKRNTHIFADYRQGIQFVYVGMEAAEGEPADFQKQMLWSNDQPIFDKSVSSTLYDDKSGVIRLNYNNIKIAPNFTSDITSISKENLEPGMVLRITGNPDAAASKAVKDNAKFDLTADFAINSNKTLTLIVNDDYSCTEISRTDVSATQANEVEFTGTAIDATEGNYFRYTGVANATLGSVSGGVDSKNIKIYGNTGVTLTIQNIAGELTGLSSAVTLTADTHWIQLTYVDGIWVKTKLSNA
ncbi:hypothetical protein ACLI1A_10205 [Flavobacterium sp. RHBU_3]|uniref:hypothetical protein n=1 Tax=Flavobacterium sp. RHBU_3 TaxID=3391184 RepID=UPI003984C92F